MKNCCLFSNLSSLFEVEADLLFVSVSFATDLNDFFRFLEESASYLAVNVALVKARYVILCSDFVFLLGNWMSLFRFRDSSKMLCRH